MHLGLESASCTLWTLPFVQLFRQSTIVSPIHLHLQWVPFPSFSSSPLSLSVELDPYVSNRPKVMMVLRWLNTAILLVAPLAYARALSVDTLSLMVEHI